MSLKLQSSLLAVNNARIYTAGEKEFLAELERGTKGIPLNRSLQEDIKVMKKELGLGNYKFPF